MKNTSKLRGFTLVEIAIVLVIIGLIIGGVIKGQALIQQARVKNVMRQVDAIRAGVMTFYDRFGVYPGDENRVGVPNGDTNDGNGNGQIAGAGVGSEAYFLYEDLMRADMITGNYNGNNQAPTHSFGDIILLYWVTPPAGATNHWFRLDNLPWDVALEIDTKLDDGVFNTGSVLANEDYVPASGAIGNLYIKM